MILGVSFDTPDANKKFKEKFDFPYDLLSDEGRSDSIAFGAADSDSPRPSRVSVLIGPDGKVGVLFRDDRDGGAHHVWFTQLGCVTGG